MTRRACFKSDPDTEESEERSRLTQLEQNLEEWSNRIAELTLESQELRRRFRLDLRREVREENQTHNQIIRNRIGQVEIDNRILRADIIDLSHPFQVPVNPNMHSPGDRIEVTNSRNRSKHFGIVTSEREGRAHVTFENTGRRTCRAVTNVRRAREQS